MMPREIGLIGLGDMGSKIAERLQGSGYSLVLYNRSQEKYSGFAGKDNVRSSSNLDEFVSMLRKDDGEIVVWSMLPGGEVTNAMMLELSSRLRRHDIIIDASNSVYDDSIRNARILGEKSISYLDVGLAEIRQREDKLFRIPNEFSSNYIAGMLDSMGRFSKNGIYFDGLTPQDEVMLANLGVHTRYGRVSNISTLIGLAMKQSLILKEARLND